MKLHLARLVAILALVFSAAACGDDGPTGSSGNIIGSYRLRSINGNAVPFSTTEGTMTFTIVSGNLTINAGSTFSTSLTASISDGGQTFTQTVLCPGTYSRNGNSLSLTTATTDDCDAETFVGTISGTTITVAFDGAVQAVYRK